MNLIKLYLRYIYVYVRTQLEYKFAFFSDIIINILWFSSLYLGIWIIFNKFHLIKDWSYYEVMLLYTINLFSGEFAGMFVWYPMMRMEDMVQNGDFDSILIRPLNPLVHMIIGNFDHTFIGQIVLSTILFVICLQKLVIVWTITKVLSFILILISAIIIQASILILSGAFSFWIIKSRIIIDLTWNHFSSIRKFIDFPITIYNKSIQFLLVFIIPYAFINFVPVNYFINKSQYLFFHPYIQFLTPVISCALLALACLAWKIGLKKYNSTGS